MEFSDRKVFVAGGSRGIGAAIVRRFSAAGASVVFTYAASADAAIRLAAETGAQALRADAGEREELIGAIRDAGPIDMFVYNAGLLVFGDPLALSAANVERMISVNINGAYFGSVEASRLMPDGGRIIVIGSDTADSMPFTGLSAYVMTKAAVQGMARGLSRDMGPRGITVNVIQPGPTDTDMNPAGGHGRLPCLGRCLSSATAQPTKWRVWRSISPARSRAVSRVPCTRLMVASQPDHRATIAHEWGAAPYLTRSGPRAGGLPIGDGELLRRLDKGTKGCGRVLPTGIIQR